MWSDELRHASARVHRRRIVVGLALGAAAGASGVAAALGFMSMAAMVALGVATLGAGWLLGSSAERTLGHRWLPLPSSVNLPLNLEEETSVSDRDDIRETNLGAFGHFRVTSQVLVVETLLATTAARIEDLAWAYGIHYPGRRLIPFLPDTSLVLKFGNGADITLPCFQRQVTPCLSAIRYFAGHAALGWDPSLADSWETDRPAFVASVQARLGRISGAGDDA